MVPLISEWCNAHAAGYQGLARAQPREETQIIQRAIGYSWGFSYESDPSGYRQKIILTGCEENMARALIRLREAKLSVMELADTSAEELLQPRSHDLDKMYNERDETDNVLY